MEANLETNRVAAHQAALETKPEQGTAPSNRRWPIPGDTLAKATAELPDEQRTAMRWLADYCRRQNLNVHEAAELLKKPNGESYSYASVYAAFTGRRDGHASLDNLAESITKFRRRVEESAPREGLEFIETSLSRKIESYCRRAFERHRVGFIFGESQIGKTVALSHYATKHNHGETKMIRMPTRGNLSDLLNELSALLNVAPNSKHADRRRRIIECFDEKTLIVVDECHQCFGNYGIDRVASLEFIREIHDRRKCGVVLCGTNVFRDQLAANKVLRQLALRGLPPLQLPAISTDQDLATFADAYDLSAAPDKEITVHATDGSGKTVKHTDNPARLQRDVNREFGLGRWCAILDEARDIARSRRTAMSWGAVILAHAQFEALGYFDAEAR